MEAMLPAPKASTLPGKSTSNAKAMSSTYFVEFSIVEKMCEGVRKQSMAK